MREQLPHQTGPPAASRIPSVRKLHGEEVTDDYAWMRDPDDPALHDYLISERAFYDVQREEFDALARTLAAEAAARFPAGAEYSVAWPRGGFFYRTRVPADSDNLQLLRTPAGEAGETRAGEASEQILLDDNILAARTGFVDVGVREPSPDGALLAWSADTSGAETYELRVRDLRTGEDLPEVIATSYPGVAWCAASQCRLLPRARRAAPPVPGVAPPGGSAIQQRRARVRGAGPAVRADLEQLAQRRAGDHHPASPRHDRGPADPAGRPARRPGVSSSRAGAGSNTGSISARRRPLHRHRRRRARVHADARAAASPPGAEWDRLLARPSRPRRPIPGCSAATCSGITWC